jgi:dephospho-CoA kinase
MRVIGLTGGIASGKSTVARMLEELGAKVVDADQVAREVVKPGEPAFDDIVATFGREVLDENGTIDRKKLGAMVFADVNKRHALNAITHPRIAAATQAKVQELGAAGETLAIYEAALLVENKAHLAMDGLIVAACTPEKQLERLRARDGFEEEDAQKRVAAQLPLDEKTQVADYVVDTNGTIDDTKRQVDEVWASIKAGGPKRL